MVDIHSHILPQVDDGARSWEMAIHMCQMAAQDGIEHMVATPHSNHEYVYDRERFTGLLEELGSKINPKIDLTLGCDFHMSFDNLERLFENPSTFTIGSTPYLLVELSDYAVPPGLTSKFQEIIDWGLMPILTHPERNPILQRSPERVLRWASVGCIVQITASSLTGRWGKRAQSTAEWFFRNEVAHVLATDAHSIDSRPPILSAGRDVVADLCGDDVAFAVVTDNPRAIVQGERVPYFPTPKNKGR